MAREREGGSSSRSSTEPAHVRIGVVARPHGVQGAFHVGVPTDRLNLFEPGRSLTVGGTEKQIVWRGGTAAKPLLRLAGVDDRDAAERLRGAALEVPREEFGSLAEGEHLVRDLLGCTVTDGARQVGVVRGVLTLPSVDCLEVAPGSGEEPEGDERLLVPLVGDAIRSLDLDARRIDVDLAFVSPE